MTQEERRIYLIRTLQAELPQYLGIEIPTGEAEQKRLLRSLMNVRPVSYTHLYQLFHHNPLLLNKLSYSIILINYTI